MNGKAIDGTKQIDGLPWYQTVTFSLRPMVMSKEQDSVSFWTLRPDTLALVKLRAIKETEEQIQVNNSTVKAQRVRVTPDNELLSFFWQGNYWFRSQDGVFVKFEGINGPPGTPKTVIELVQVINSEFADSVGTEKRGRFQMIEIKGE